MGHANSTSVASPGPVPIRLISFNVRYATKNPVPGEEPWSVRCPKLCAQLRFITAGQDSPFICLQEVLHSQLTDIQDRLGTPWRYIGIGREDGKQAGEFSPIFFRVDHWDCERQRTYWLSKTPDVPSKGWDAALERIATVGLFRHKETGARLVAMSTHFDHRGRTAREESAKLLLEISRSWTTSATGGTQVPAILGGDFNSTPSDGAYKVLAAPGSGMLDISQLVPESDRYGNQDITYTSFGEPDETPQRIDFLFVRDPQKLAFRNFGILPNRFDDMVYLSDHRALVADMELSV
ncbi:Endonuclease/exonuclease/phosphatase [Triangularia verruculosa]|uniref:Endonuclease/exonuclease/phosphatase n=1 Tax=Triangularia verruculosa TaxID=2587418 RepID=A0AAN6XPN9_9PEZI|nr:Endonuclease/exonuclease/phosphatase [Triangularia verruculosa]